VGQTVGHESGCADWLHAEADVRELVPELKKRSVSRVLDLGCGMGRHSVLLAAKGFEVSAIDASKQAVAYTEDAARKAVALDIGYSMMTKLPYEDGYFDYVLSWNVIYHGVPRIVCRTIAEIHRVLRAGGIFQGTMQSSQDL
jgi:2-polyprenyl-3-methyl-5-hydroxy-6-metoxy-1,4-benzoquinol methylase